MMNLIRTTTSVLMLTCFLLTLSALILPGCSSNSANPAFPGTSDDYLSVPLFESQDTNHSFLGAWCVEFNVNNLTANTEIDRTSAMHYNITTFLPTPGIVLNSYDPGTGIADVDVTITNPFTFGAYDVRLIIYSDNAGHRLENPDDWTGLWDIPEGGPINGFKAYAKSEPDRLFAGQTQHIENLQIHMPGGNFMVQFAIDGSFPTNCEEPYLIENFSHEELEGTPGADTSMQVDVYDWQDDTTGVFLYCPAVTNETLTPLSYDSGNTWTGTITNNAGIAEGQWAGVIVAFSGGIALYDYVVITVTPPRVGWVQAWGGTSHDKALYVALDSEQNIYTAGHFYETTDFDPGDGVYELVSKGKYDIFLSKFNNDGEFQWARSWGNDTHDLVWGMVVDSSDNIYLLGEFDQTVDFDPGSGTYELVSTGAYDAFISKFNNSGDWLSAITWGGIGYDGLFSLNISDTDEIFATGQFQGTIDFDPGTGTDEYAAIGAQDCYVTKFDSSGTWLWAKAWGGSGGDHCKDTVVKNDDSFYVVGSYSLTVDFDPGSGEEKRTSLGYDDVYISDFDSSGNFLWVTSFGGADIDWVRSICLDSEENFYVAGTFQETSDFDPGGGIDEYTSNGSNDVYLCKYDSSRNYLWALTFGGSESESLYAFDKDNEDNLLLGGTFHTTVDFDPGPGDHFITSVGGNDAYLLKLDEDGIFVWANSWGSTGSESLGDVISGTDNLVYACGSFSETVDFDPGLGIEERTSSGSIDAFLLKLKSSGGM